MSVDKEFLKNVVDTLKKNSYEYSLEAYINCGMYYVQEIFVYNCREKNEIKKSFEKDVLKNVSIIKSCRWYLGDRKEAIVIVFKKHIELPIGEFEAMQTSNYA